jgi:hypothetical protein
MLWLPTLLVALMAGSGFFIWLDYDLEIWDYPISAPGTAPHCKLKTTLAEPLFSDEDYIWDLFIGAVPSGWQRVYQKRRTALRVDWPRGVAPVTVAYGGAPLLILLTGFLPCRLLAVWCVRIGALERSGPQVRRSIRSASSLVALLVGMPMWTLTAVTTVTALRRLLSPSIPPHNLAMLLYVTLFALVVNAVAWPLLVLQERAGRIFASRGLICLALGSVAVALPPATVMLILWIIL